MLGGYNTTGTPSSFPWTIDMAGLGSFRSISSLTGTINNLYSNIIAVNNDNTQRATNDIFEVCTSPTTGNYLYYNNTSVCDHINTSNSNLSWYINQNGSAQIPSINTTTANITTDNVGTLNVSRTASIATNLCINSTSMRTISDKLNVSLSSTGPYLFFNDGGT